jgi:hypothetical protein
VAIAEVGRIEEDRRVPQTSGMAPAFDAAIGQPHAIASSGGIPKPS